MPTFLLIRHGENDYFKQGRLAGRLPGIALNQQGRQQVQVLREKLASAPIRAIYSSPLERAMETAGPIASSCSLEVTPRSGLLEVDIGEWQGQTLKRLRRLKDWKIVQTAPSRMQFPAGETFFEAQTRICHELEALTKLHDEKDLLVCVSHSDPIKLAVAYFIGLPLDLFQRLHVAPASITILQIGSQGSNLLALNQDLSFNLTKT